MNSKNGTLSTEIEYYQYIYARDDVCLKSYWTGVRKKNLSITDNRLDGFSDKVIPPNKFSHPSLICFYIQLEGFFWDDPELRRYSSLNDFHAFQTDPIDDSLDLGEKEK